MPELDALRTAYRHPEADGDSNHLTADQWEGLACEELSAEERQGALDHILRCAQCSDTYRAIQVLQTEARAFDVAAAAPLEIAHEGGPKPRVPWRGIGIFATAATVLLVIILPLRRGYEPVGDDGTRVVRGTDGESIPSPVSPVGTMLWRSGDDLSLVWTESTSAVLVEILDIDGEPIWTSPFTKASKIMWPGDNIPGPGRYYWRLVAREDSPGGTASEMVSFDIEEMDVSASPP